MIIECQICGIKMDERTAAYNDVCLECAVEFEDDVTLQAYYRYRFMWFNEHDDWRVSDEYRPVCYEEFLDNEYAINPELYN